MTMIGSRCPDLGHGLTFIKGGQTHVPARGNPTIIEFWASWCGPCRAAFPHLSGLARKFKDYGLLVVGINIERDEAVARRMVAQQGSNMEYSVALDMNGHAVSQLMERAGLSGIPCAFIIDDRGIVRHYGHPMEPRFSQIVEEVCKQSGRSDANKHSDGTSQPGSKPSKLSIAGQSKADLLKLSVKELKTILDSWNVSYADLNEKGELVDRILERCHM